MIRDGKPVPNFVIVMKVGFHGTEGLDQILARKRDELARLGVCYWGYGGTLCHPVKALKAFVDMAREAGEDVHVLFSITQSPFLDESDVRAGEFSLDGVEWDTLPAGADIRSSRFALAIDQLEMIEEELDLGEYEVAVGPSVGRKANEYLKFRVDKAALVRSRAPCPAHSVPIQIRARLVAPYAILVRPLEVP